MQSTQEIAELILDSNRNALLALDLKVRGYLMSITVCFIVNAANLQVSIMTLGIGTGALVAGLFGMNVCHFKKYFPRLKFTILSCSAISSNTLMLSFSCQVLRPV